MRFGYHHGSYQHPGEGTVFSGVADFARRLEDDGFDWFTVMDHLWQLPGVGQTDEPFLDAYTVLPAVAAVTDRMEVGALVTCPYYRNPAMLGRIMSSLDNVSGGRSVLGIGAGWYQDEFEAYGFEFPDVPTRMSRLADTIQLVKAMWTEESPVSYDGEHHSISDLILEPKPIREPHPPVLVGGAGEQLTLRIVAEHADRCNVPLVDPDEFAHKMDVLEGHCEDVGRDVDDIEKTVFHSVCLRETAEEAHEVVDRAGEKSEMGAPPREERFLVGTPAEACEALEAYEDAGVDAFLTAAPRNDRQSVDLFVDEVLPAF